jgi:SCY1-like protein 2
MFAVATSFFARTNISQSYNIGSSVPQGIGSLSRPATPGGKTTSLTAPAAATPAFFIGLWKVQSAWHKVTNKRVSVWIFDKRGPDVERLSPPAKERAIEVMKAEVSCMNSTADIVIQLFFLQASALGRLRHPSILGAPSF